MRPRAKKLWQTAGSVACLIAILMTLGGHWMALQSFAWARMISEISSQEPLSSAIAKTFGGEHPCELCVAIQHGKNSEKKSDQLKPMGKIDGFLVVHL